MHIDLTKRLNADATRAVSMMEGLSPTQRAALWQLLATTTSSRNNPFNRRAGDQASNRAVRTEAILKAQPDEAEQAAPGTGGSGLRWAGSPENTAQELPDRYIPPA